MRRVAQIMGMPISVDIPDCADEPVFDGVFELFKDVDKRFSPFKKNSELSRFNRREVTETKLSRELKMIIKACTYWEKKTGGYFSAWYGGKFDPSGYVKGWAIKRAGDLIKEQGYGTFCIGVGGDILAASDSDKTWSIGIQNPLDKKSLTSQVNLKNGAVATSGSYERGEHVINPISGKPAKELLSLSVVGPDIIKTDVLATAGFAMGKTGAGFIGKQKGYKALAVTRKVIGNDISKRQA